jgi:hypothetical protein
MAVPEQRTMSFAVVGPIARADLPGLCERVCALLAGSDARLQLAARRRGCQVRLRGASDELRSLVTFMGLENVLAE